MTEEEFIEEKNEVRPVCHFTPMEYVSADDGCQTVEFWECKHCGHTKEICRSLSG